MTARNSRFDVIGQLASLRRHTSSLTHSDTDAEDLVQNAVLRAYQKRASFRDGASLRILVAVDPPQRVHRWSPCA